MHILVRSCTLWEGMCVCGCVSTCVALCVLLAGICCRKGVLTGVYRSLMCLRKLCGMSGVCVSMSLCVSCVRMWAQGCGCARWGHRTSMAAPILPVMSRLAGMEMG